MRNLLLFLLLLSLGISGCGITNQPEESADVPTLPALPDADNCTDNMQLVENVTEGDSVQPGASFSQKWRVRNTGTCTWGSGYSISKSDGAAISASTATLPSTAPNSEVEISINTTISSSAPRGTDVTATFRLQDADGSPFGEVLPLKLRVAAAPTNTPGSSTGNNTGNRPPATCTNDSDFVLDVNVPDGTSIVIGSSFTKTWRLRNAGTCTWNSGYTLAQKSSSGLSANPQAISLPSVAPGQTVDLSMTLTLANNVSPGTRARATYQLKTPSGQFFGTSPYVEVIAQRPSSGCTNDSDFVRDIDVPDGTEVQRGATFTKTWRLRNAGTCAWDASYRFVQKFGSGLTAAPLSIPLPLVQPGQEIDLTMTLTLHPEIVLGSEALATFQIQAANGQFFGTSPYVEVVAVDRGGTVCELDSDFVRDVDVPDGTLIVPGTVFTKTWRLRNSGSCAWDGRYHLVKRAGSSLVMAGFTADGTESVPLPVVAPGQEVDITVTLRLLETATVGQPQEARFQIQAPDGSFFGTSPYVLVTAATRSEQPTPDEDCTNDMAFVEDITIPDGTLIRPAQPFVKSWRIRNTGTCTWDSRYTFRQIEGSSLLATPSSISVPPVAPGTTVDISMSLMLSLETPLGTTARARFRLYDENGVPFGQQPYAEVVAAQ